MGALKKPVGQDRDPSQEERDIRAEILLPARSGRPASPVHVLQARIEAAFSADNERRTLRIATMVLVVSLSLWIAATRLVAG